MERPNAAMAKPLWKSPQLLDIPNLIGFLFTVRTNLGVNFKTVCSETTLLQKVDFIFYINN